MRACMFVDTCSVQTWEANLSRETGGSGPACHLVSRLLSHLAGEAQIFFFVFSHSFTYLKVVGIFAKPQQPQQQLSLNFPLISHPYPRHRHHCQRAKGAEANGKRQEKGGRTYLFFFSITAKAGQGKEVYAIPAGGKKIPLLLQFPICCFPSFRDHRGGGGKCHSLTAVDSEEDWGKGNR